MDSDISRVIISTGFTAGATQVHHRDFPEIRASGESAAIAAGYLRHQLERALDSALTTWRRQVIEQAIADVQAFSGQTSDPLPR
jgi:hypothetical protein